MSEKRTVMLEAAIVLLVILLLFATSFAYSATGNGADEAESLSFTAQLPPAPVAAIHWGRDPFIPLIKGDSSPDMKLSAIFYNKANPSAIINGNVVYRKSKVGGQKVVDIGKTHVILQGISGRIVLEIADLPKFPKAGRYPVSPAYNNKPVTGR